MESRPPAGIASRAPLIVILDATSPQRRELDRAGVEVAWDGMEIDL